MSNYTSLPKTASVADPVDGAKLDAPAARRNADAIADVLRQFAPKQGQALELASGTGQHVVHFARALPGLNWQPSEVDPDRRASIDAWGQEAALDNLRPAITLDATTPGWGAQHKGQNLILLVNLLHLIPEAAARTLIAEAAQALAPAGRFVLYGPFLRAGVLTSDGDASFHASLQQADPAIGYKDDFDVIDWLHSAGLALLAAIEMPANNLCLVAGRPG